MITVTCELAHKLLGVLHEQFTRLLGESIMHRVNKTSVDILIDIISTNAKKAKLTKASQADIDVIIQALMVANDKLLELRGARNPRKSLKFMFESKLKEKLGIS